MTSKVRSTVLTIAMWFAVAGAAIGQTNSFKVLHSFGGPGDGIGPSSGVIFDKHGNAYGETLGDGNSSCHDGCGLVYELTPEKGVGWVETILYQFTGGNDGYAPNGGLAIDSAGDLYGVTRFGGANGYGTAFELTPSSGSWEKTILHSFCTPPSDADGCEPYVAPVLDSSGNLYGTTFNGGANQGGGVVYELSPGASSWTATILYTLCSQPNCADGDDPNSLTRDAAGNLFGSAYEGGAALAGAIFELKPQPNGQWQYQVLYSFQAGKDGMGPNAVALHRGALYGTTANGGGSNLCTDGCGTVFELAASKTGGSPTEVILHRFGPFAEGTIPGAIAFDSNGDAFGLTNFGGCCGLIFEMTPAGSGKPPAYQIAHQFEGADGAAPIDVSTHGDNVFGTTLSGGQYNVGVVFEIMPSSQIAK